MRHTSELVEELIDQCSFEGSEWRTRHRLSISLRNSHAMVRCVVGLQWCIISSMFVIVCGGVYFLCVLLVCVCVCVFL